MSAARPSGRALLALAVGAILSLAVGCPPTGSGGGQPKPKPKPSLPFERTEERADCDHFDPQKQPFFGETHIHTALSADASINGTENDARDAYRFALGAELLGSTLVGKTVQLRRPLDFAVVTDHAEFLGELPLCLDPGSGVYDELECFAIRFSFGATVAFNVGLSTLFLPTATPFTPRFDWCGTDGELCLDSARTVWLDIQDAAEEFYDRSSDCSFTTFPAYEWSGNTSANNLHRNVIFRNAQVPSTPTSYYEAGLPELLWPMLQQECNESIEGCDVLAIPHNSNISGGAMFTTTNESGDTLTADEAALRVAVEPIVEIFQHKADSECFPGLGNADELCGFEKTSGFKLAPPQAGQSIPRNNFVREALKDGLKLQDEIGVNPFKLGFLAATDAHMANSGMTNEEDFALKGHVGTLDADPVQRLNRVGTFSNEAASGGLAVIWAEENSRDALFEALERREVYGTSGTRPIVRVFGGANVPDSMCEKPSFAATGYKKGVPMGGTLIGFPGGAAPRMAVSALQDVGLPGDPGTALQRIQIVKGWVDENGDSQEAVYDVAGDPDNGASVDLDTCEPQGQGYSSLCTVWEDPDFDGGEQAFYYARVLENPTCRWTGHLCLAEAIDCGDPAGVPEGFEPCCDGSLPLTQQERAWTSPIWYEPKS